MQSESKPPDIAPSQAGICQHPVDVCVHVNTNTALDIGDVEVVIPTPPVTNALAGVSTPPSFGQSTAKAVGRTPSSVTPTREEENESEGHGALQTVEAGHTDEAGAQSDDVEGITLHIVDDGHTHTETTHASDDEADAPPPPVPSWLRARCPLLVSPATALMKSARDLVARARGMTWRQLIFVAVLVALVMIGNFMQILMLNFWLVSFPADGTPGNFTAFAVPGILFSLFFLGWCVGYILIKRPNLSFAKHRYGWTLLITIGFCDTFNSWMATYAASYTSEVLQALFTNLAPLYAVFMSKWILKDPRQYWNPWIISVFVLTITGILAASLYGIIKEGKHMEDGQWWILIFFASIPFRVLQNVVQSLYMIVYTRDDSFSFWLRNHLALVDGGAGAKRAKRKRRKKNKKSKLSGSPSMPEGVVDAEEDEDEEEDSSKSDNAWRINRTKAAVGISDRDDDDDDDDDNEDEDSGVMEADILDERALAARLLHDQADCHMVPMVLPAPPPSMCASFARNPDVGGAVSNASIAHSLLPREPSLAALGAGSDVVHVHHTGARSYSSTTPSLDGRGARRTAHSTPHRTPLPATDGDEAAAAATSAASPTAEEEEEIVAVRYHQGEDTIVKLVMLAGETVAQMCFTLALLPADALPWWGNSDSVANTWSNFLEGIICVFTMPMNFLFGFLYTLGFVCTYVGGAYLNHYSVALCSIVTQLSSPLTALVLVLVPSWNVMEGGDSPWFCSVIAIVFLSIAALLYVMWEEKTDAEKIEGERVLKMNKLHVCSIEEELEHAGVGIFPEE